MARQNFPAQVLANLRRLISHRRPISGLRCSNNLRSIFTTEDCPEPVLRGCRILIERAREAADAFVCQLVLIKNAHQISDKFHFRGGNPKTLMLSPGGKNLAAG